MLKRVIGIVVISVFTFNISIANDIECYTVEGTAPNGNNFCGVACTDHTFYPMSCDADIMIN